MPAASRVNLDLPVRVGLDHSHDRDTGRDVLDSHALQLDLRQIKLGIVQRNCGQAGRRFPLRLSSFRLNRRVRVVGLRLGTHRLGHRPVVGHVAEKCCPAKSHPGPRQGCADRSLPHLALVQCNGHD